MRNTSSSGKCMRTTCGLIASVGIVLGGCGQGAGELNTREDVASKSSPLECYNDMGDPACVWKELYEVLPSTSKNEISQEQSPALCGQNGYASIFSVQAGTHTYRTLQFGTNGFSAAWGNYGTRSFASGPACTFRENDSSGRPGFVIAGKDLNSGAIFASAGVMGPSGNPPGNPTATTVFSQVGTGTYNRTIGSVDGSPALATGGINQTRIVMTFMAGQSIYAYVHNEPYTSGAWSGLITGPALPNGWVAQGAPAITWLPEAYYIIVHARNGSSDRFFVTHFNSDSEFFSDFSGRQVSAWEMQPDIGHIDKAPAIGNSDYLTVYFLNGNKLMQTTSPIGGNPVLQVEVYNSTPPAFTSSPAASDGFAYDPQGGTHNVIALAGSHTYTAYSNMNNNLVP